VTAKQSSCRRGRWRYEPNCGWLLDDTQIVIDRERYADAWCYVARGGPFQAEPIDRYLDGAMRHIETLIDREQYL